MPVTMAAEALATMTEGIVEVLVDNREAAQNLRDYAAENGMTTVQSREDRGWKVQITKRYDTTANRLERRALPRQELYPGKGR